MRRPSARWIGWALAGAVAAATPTSAQVLGGGGLGGLGGGLGSSLGGVMGGAIDSARRIPDDRPPPERRGTPRPLPVPAAVSSLPQAVAAAAAELTAVRALAAARLVRDHPDAVEVDEDGAPVVRGEVLALAPSPQALEAAGRAGFAVRERIASPELGIESVILIAPPGLSAREAVRRLRAIDPGGRYDFDHIYQESGVTAGEAGGPAAGRGRTDRTLRLGLVDGSAAVSHPALRSARVTQRAFAPGGERVSAHATAVASLLVGSQGDFEGAAPGATLLVADVYGPTPAGGSAAAIVRGLAWLAENQVGVVNISLVGPPNLLLQVAIKGLAARGTLVVAAVGNDGPAAPPLYPAAYPGVVAVTGVDARRQALPEAGRGAHVVLAAPGAQMAAASADGGYTTVRGTSFAAPLVAGALARDLPRPDPAAAARALRRLEAGAQDLGAPGRDPVFGFGAVALDRRVEPARVGARALALRGP